MYKLLKNRILLDRSDLFLPIRPTFSFALYWLLLAVFGHVGPANSRLKMAPDIVPAWVERVNDSRVSQHLAS